MDVQIMWAGQWRTIASGYKSRSDAEWAIGTWKQENECFRDPFRVVQSPGLSWNHLEEEGPLTYNDE
jgi:hypothetical protein